jgi:hypothetical protein
MSFLTQIGRKRSFVTIVKRGWTRIKAIAVSIENYLARGAEIHNRVTAMQEERYARNWYSIRGMRCVIAIGKSGVVSAED